MSKKILAWVSANREALVYLVVGMVTTGINWSIYIIALSILNGNIELSNAVAWIVAVIAAFFMNKVIVFQSREWALRCVMKESILFLTSRIFTGVVEISAVPVLLALGMSQSLFGLEGFYAKVVATILAIVLNYFFSKNAVFRKRRMQNACSENDEMRISR